MAESSDAEPASLPRNNTAINNPKTLGETTPFVDYAVEQALLYQKAFDDALQSAVEASKSRLSQIRSTSSAYYNHASVALHDLKSEYNAYEDLLFGKIKEGILVAASHPMITCGTTVGLGLVLLKNSYFFVRFVYTAGPRQILYYNTLRLFVSEEAMIKRANTQVKELRQTIELLKAESEKLEKRALHGEEEFLRGRTKLRQAGKQIRSLIQSAYKIERRAGGLKDILGELPKSEASHFQSQVKSLASEAKQEKNALTKEVSKISNYGISV
ncbi:RGS1-HXK1-interacting protein 1-like [Senna tora]|uniref:RGS1-HXK1-interacting protein 1-like n=1 Tax=Senna tora TaxID=362788 RepID=A0A834WQ65_9FABA|nr:RGS1-HXK1-interacting protein 1-like [Senna tora]